MTGAKPLDGLRVLDTATLFAGPMVATMLGDFGAEVIKIEHPRGDPLRHHGGIKDGEPLLWKMANRNKLGITLSLSTDIGADIFKRLVADADVLVENFRPGTLERWGVGWETLHEINPRLVMTRVTGFGQTGPYSRRPGFGTIAEAMTGFAHVTGLADGPPTLPPFGLADGVCAMTGTWATMMALYQRDVHGGSGQMVDMAIYEPLMTILGGQPIIYDQTGVIQTRTGNRSVNNSPRNTYKSSDDRWIAISTSANPIAERMMRLVGRPDYIEEPWFGEARGRVQHADELDAAVGAWMAERTAVQIVTECESAEVAAVMINTVADVVADPHINARGSLIRVPDPVLGSVLMQNVIARLSETPGEIRATGPALGQHNDMILRDRYGLDAEDLERVAAGAGN
jgi:crotonobetainyl-CoA:carnitine CoA-transferase CaiB-like acyl-CoA transferase